MTHHPIANRVIVERDPETNTTAGGIFTSETTRPTTGKVIAVGPGRINPKNGKVIPVEVEVGQRVYFTALAGNRLQGTENWIMKDEFILGVLDD